MDSLLQLQGRIWRLSTFAMGIFFALTSGCTSASSGHHGGAWCSSSVPLCSGGNCTLDIDLKTVSLGGQVKWDDQLIPDTYNGNPEWKLTFVDPKSQDAWTATFEGGTGTWSMPMYTGVYDVYFDFVYSGVVTNQVDGRVRIAKGFEVKEGATLDIDPKPVTLSGSIAWNGQTIPDTYNGNPEWKLVLVDKVTGDTSTHDFEGGTTTYSTRVYPSDYDVYFDFVYSGVMPDELIGKHRVSSIHLAADSTLDVNPALVTLSGSAAWNGQPIPDTYNGNDEWHLRLTTPSGDETFYQTFNGGASSYSMKVYPGTYDVWFDFQYAGTVPDQISGEHRLQRGLSIAADSTLDVNPTLVTVSGAASWNGQPIPDTYNGNDEWMLRFKNADGEDYIATFNGGAGTYSTKLYPGTYDVYFDFRYSGTVPDQISGNKRIEKSKSFATDTTLDVNPILATVSGAASWNGAAIPDTYNGNDEWTLRFVNADADEEFVQTFNGGSANWSTKLYPGKYDVFFDFLYSGTVPDEVDGQHALVRDFTVPAAGTTYDIAPALVTLGGAITWNGATIPDTYNGNDEWGLTLHNEATGETFGSTFNGGTNAWQMKMYPGVYDLTFDFLYSGTLPDEIDGARRVQSCGKLEL